MTEFKELFRRVAQLEYYSKYSPSILITAFKNNKTSLIKKHICLGAGQDKIVQLCLYYDRVDLLEYQYKIWQCADTLLADICQYILTNHYVILFCFKLMNGITFNQSINGLKKFIETNGHNFTTEQIDTLVNNKFPIDILIYCLCLNKQYDDKDTIRKLLTLTTIDQQTCLYYSALNNNYVLTNFFLTNKIILTDIDFYNVMFNSNIEIINLILHSHKYKLNYSILLQACQQDRDDLVEIFIDYGATIDLDCIHKAGKKVTELLINLKLIEPRCCRIC